MTRDAMAEVLDVEGALEARGKESAEGRDEGGEDSHDEDVALERRVRDRLDLMTELHMARLDEATTLQG